jgi:hypothetical protein
VFKGRVRLASVFEEGRWIGESRRGDGLGSRGGAIDWGVEEGHDDK